MKFILHSFSYFIHQNNSREMDLFQWVDVGLFSVKALVSAQCKEAGIPVLQCKSQHNPVIPQQKLTRLGKQRALQFTGSLFFFPFVPTKSGCNVRTSVSNDDAASLLLLLCLLLSHLTSYVFTVSLHLGESFVFLLLYL